MNQAIFSYLMRKVKTDFEKCSWSDSVAMGYQEKELCAMEKSLKEMKYLEDEIIEFQKKVEQLLHES